MRRVWHELLVNAADQKATVKFYQDLFGWDVEESKGYVSLGSLFCRDCQGLSSVTDSLLRQDYPKFKVGGSAKTFAGVFQSEKEKINAEWLSYIQ